MSATRDDKLGKALAIAGAFLQCGPLLGIAGTVLGMVGAFHNLGDTGISDPKLLSASVSVTLTATVIGMAAGALGMILLAVAIFACRYRARWLFWFLVNYSILLLAGFPIGTVIGIAVIISCVARKDQFLGAAPAIA